LARGHGDYSRSGPIGRIGRSRHNEKFFFKKVD
jgi:hypothetical protein